MRSFERLIHDFENGAGTQSERLLAFCKRYPSEVAKIRRQVLHPVPVNGSTNRGLKMGYFMTPLRDGTHGYFQRRTDDCLQAAVSSCSQIPPHRVPDLHIDQLLLAGKEPEEIMRIIGEKMTVFMGKHGVTIRVHPSPPTSGRWIGVVPAGGVFFDHCLLMNGRDCLFDTASLLPPGKDQAVSERDPADIEYGITIE
jgi:hypothetical protein